MMLLRVAAFVAAFIQVAAIGRGTPTTTVAASGVLTADKLSLAGCFLTAGVNSGSHYTTDFPVFMRKVGSRRYYSQIGGDGIAFEFPEPALKPCSTAIASLSVGRVSGTWARIPDLNGSQESVNNGPSGTGVIRGMWYDVTTNRVVINWSGSYTNIPRNLNNFAVLTPDFVSHTWTLNGCYAYGGGQPYAGAGTMDIPSAYVSAHLPAGARWGMTGGLLASATSGNEYGPSLRAVVPPAPNGCRVGQDSAPVGGKVLASYAPSGNPRGPHCRVDENTSSGSALGCDPSPRPPTTPYPARLAFTRYSYDLYPQDWDPWPHASPTTGYMSDYTSWRAIWWKDVTEAYIVPYTMTSGYLNTTVVSSSGVGRVRLASCDMHDGYKLNPDDWFSMQTCTPGADANCARQNNNHLTAAYVDTINQTTCDITYTVTSSDFGSGNHIPVKGAPAYAGPHYKSSIPGWPRSVLRMQIWDVSQFTAVLGGGNPWVPTYSEDFSLYDMGVTNLGEPRAGRGIRGATPNATRGSSITVTSIIKDEDNKQFIVFLKDVGVAAHQSMGIVINVAR